jgi:hypothetical protein
LNAVWAPLPESAREQATVAKATEATTTVENRRSEAMKDILSACGISS